MYALVYIHISYLCSLRGPRSNKSPGIMRRPNAQILASEHHPPIKEMSLEDLVIPKIRI